MPAPLLGHVLQDWARGDFREEFTPVFPKIPTVCRAGGWGGATWRPSPGGVSVKKSSSLAGPGLPAMPVSLLPFSVPPSRLHPPQEASRIPPVRDLGVAGCAWLSLTGWRPCKAPSPGLGFFVCKRRWFTAGGWGGSSFEDRGGFLSPACPQTWAGHTTAEVPAMKTAPE